MRVGTWVGIESVKPGGRLHRRWPQAVVLAEPDGGQDAWVLGIPPTVPVIEANGQRWGGRYPVLVWFWPEVNANAFYLIQPRGVRRVYANVASPPRWLDAPSEWPVPVSAIVRYTDWELDFVWRPGEEAQVLDRDEFEEAAHPASLRVQAEAGLAWLQARAAAGRPPFTARAERPYRLRFRQAGSWRPGGEARDR